MDKKKQNKEEKVGADGLTKKERRALKVQARQTDDNKVEQKNIRQCSNPKDVSKSDSNEHTARNENKNIPGKDALSVDGILKSSSEKSETVLSLKEKRKKEWEKKLATDKNLQNIDLKGKHLSKSEQKAKRRETQEAQRLAKNNNDDQNKKITAAKEVRKINPKVQSKRVEVVAVTPKYSRVGISSYPKKLLHGSKVQLLHHLYMGDSKSVELNDSVCLPNIHPAFIQLGVQYSTNTILGSNARCLSLLSALNRLVIDLRTPPKQEFCRYLESVLKNSTTYLQKCRPMAVSMLNAMKQFKLHLMQLNTKTDEEKKQKLLSFISTFIHDEIQKAGEAISLKVLEKVSNGDTILIYGCSSLIKRILVEAFEKKKKFKVIVVDSRPLLEGKEMLRRLTEAGIECIYILINALSYIMDSVTKVLLGAHALLANGYVMSRTGTAQVALVAKAYNKPVLVCCETYKFSERVQTDSLVNNEIGDPDRLLNVDTVEGPSPLSAWRENSKLTLLNLMYDVTPPDLVTAVVTELAILPCTSVPVVLRIKPTEI